jgi:hypothetical protein
MARDLAISNGRLLVSPRPPGVTRSTFALFEKYLERHSHANLCSACGQTMHPPARRTDRQTVMAPA